MLLIRALAVNSAGGGKTRVSLRTLVILVDGGEDIDDSPYLGSVVNLAEISIFSLAFYFDPQ
jgi:hypothetical protein